MWHTDVLRSLADGGHYVGMTGTCVEERLARHNAGRVKSTKGRRPFELLHAEEFATRTDARVREKFLKGGQGREFLRKITWQQSGGTCLRRASWQTR